MLTEQQLNTFFTDGYLRFPGFVPPDLLQRLHQLFDELMIPDSSAEKVLFENKGKKYVTNIERFCHKGNLACLELLGFPPLLEIAKKICGRDFFLIQEFAVIKNLGDDLPVLWHKDMVHNRTGRCFTMGIYLDDACADDGALRVVPGSHLSDDSICDLMKEPFIELPVNAGDVLIHDMLLAHSSEPLKKNKLRRVIYFEFLSAAHVFNEQIYSPELVEQRSRLTYAAVRYYSSLHPGKQQFIPPVANPVPEDDLRDIHAIVNEICSQPVNARPSAYCLENRNSFHPV